jgi:LDH2 family malate/lactate/ureidoglycolate dehydrogenase
MEIQVSKLEELCKKALNKYGYTDKEIDIISDILLYAQLRGNNQGIVKLVGRGIPKSDEAGDIKVLKETDLSVLLDGNKNMGMVVMYDAMERVLNKVSEKGFAIAGTQNTYSSTGAIGYYVRKIAEQGFIGFAYSSSPASVSPHGSCEAVFGTNPQAVGIPTSGKEPLVFDMATSAMAWFGLVEAETAGEDVAEDVGYDSKGESTTSPGEIMKGAIRPFDRSYKGYGLSMIFEILSGALVGASFAGIGERGDWGNLIFALDPELLGDRADFKRNVSKLIDRVKKSKKLPETDEILVPGERGDRIMNEVLDSGTIEVEDNLLKELKEFVRAE